MREPRIKPGFWMPLDNANRMIEGFEPEWSDYVSLPPKDRSDGVRMIFSRHRVEWKIPVPSRRDRIFEVFFPRRGKDVRWRKVAAIGFFTDAGDLLSYVKFVVTLCPGDSIYLDLSTGTPEERGRYFPDAPLFPTPHMDPELRGPSDPPVPPEGRAYS